jgi:hypothetical protein
MHRILGLALALALLVPLGACYTVVDQGPPPAAAPAPAPEPPPPAPEPPPPPPAPEPPPPPAPPPPMAIQSFCLAFATNTCNRVGACGGLGQMPVQQCTGEVNGLCMHVASTKGVAVVDRADVAGCFTAMAQFGCGDFLRAHKRGRVVKACTAGSLKPLFKH